MNEPGRVLASTLLLWQPDLPEQPDLQPGSESDDEWMPYKYDTMYAEG